ncbi:MAG: DUF4417 domain-containing protein [Phascolarctobacterium sp.]|nr:DUF4417 domain-containing protein [Phascolarctobacterium sp.]
MPELYCDTKIYPDYLALYSEKSLYQTTPLTAVCFYSFDIEFDGRNGLFWAIYFNDKKRLSYFKKRFENVKFFISPDYSVFGDIHKMENLYRIFRARIVALWFSLELHAVVIPNASYAGRETFPLYFSGLEKCSVIAMSAKSHIRYAVERRLFEDAIRYAVDNLPLKAIIVYSVCGKDEKCLKSFEYAIRHGVKIIIPENTLRTRNMNRRVS